MLARFKPTVWVVALGREHAICQGLVFSYGVWPVELDAEPGDWRAFAGSWMRANGLSGRSAMLVAGPSSLHPEANHRIEFMRLAP
jgi:pyruvate kinase